MRISIWQQFSSNHSSYFTVVGEFESPAAAQEAAAKLQEFFDAINEWFDRPENAAAKKAREESDMAPVTQPERELSKQLGIPWYKYSIDWIFLDYQPAVVDRFIFLQPHQTWQGGGTLAEVLRKFGGQGMVHGDIVSELEVTPTIRRFIDVSLSCHATSGYVAKEIHDAIKDFEAKWEPYMQVLMTGKTAGARAPLAPWAESASYPFGGFPSSAGFRADISVEEARLSFSQVKFHHLGFGIPPLIEWLKKKGCTDFQYSFTERDITEDDD